MEVLSRLSESDQKLLRVRDMVIADYKELLRVKALLAKTEY